jgi:hypothetical protein
MWALPHALHHATQRVVGFVAFYALFWLLRNNPLTQFSLWITTSCPASRDSARGRLRRFLCLKKELRSKLLKQY